MHTTIEFIRTIRGAAIPTKATEGSAGFDLTSAKVEWDGDIFFVNTGLRTSFSKGYVLKVYGRSGLCRRLGIILTNGVGIIDSDYRGDIQLMFRSIEAEHADVDGIMQALAPGNRVAQAILEPLPTVGWIEVPELTNTDRGTGGFGSTGS